MGKELLEQFYEKEVTPLLEETLQQLEADFQQHKDELKVDFLESFKTICQQIKGIQEREHMPIGFMMYNLLRTRLLQKRYTYSVRVYDETWYLKEGISVGDWDVSFFYQYVESFWQRLLKQAQKYVMKISVLDVERIVLNELETFHDYVVELMRYSIIDAVELETYLALEKANVFRIQAGEFYEPCEAVHIEKVEKNELKLKNWLKKNERKSYCFEDFTHLNLSGFQCTNMDLRYTDFRGSNLEDVALRGSVLVGAKFKNCQMKKADLMACMLQNATFEQADLTGANFSFCVAFTGKSEATPWKKIGFTGTSFKDSHLQGAHFKGATLCGVDFTGADLTDANFEEAQLYSSQFTRKQLEVCHLTAKQLEQIKIL